MSAVTHVAARRHRRVPANDARVADLTLDSREVRAGSLFLALPGTQAHGLKFAAEAAARGASAVLWEPSAEVRAAVAAARRVRAPRCRICTGWWAASPTASSTGPPRSCASPASPGTNGKTTCAYLLAQCLERLGSQRGLHGHHRLGPPRRARRRPRTPRPMRSRVHRTLAQLRSAGVREVAMEVSSHALDQERVDGVRFHSRRVHQLEPRSPGLSRHHAGLRRGQGAAVRARRICKHIVINVGDAFGRELGAQATSGRAPLTAVWVGAGRFGLAGRARAARDAGDAGPARHFDASSTAASASCTVATQLLGRFNAENSLVVLGCLLSLGVSLERGGRGAGRVHAAAGTHGSGRGRRARQAAGRGRLRAHARCARQGACARCASIARARCGACSAAAATAIPASARSWAASPTSSPIRSSSPTTIRAPRIRRPSPAPSSAASRRTRRG